MLACISVAFAEGEAESRSALYSAYLAVRAVAFPLAAVGFAGSAIQLIIGDVNSAAKAKRRMVVILVATAAVLLIPAVLSSGAGMLSSGAWNPSSPAG